MCGKVFLILPSQKSRIYCSVSCRNNDKEKWSIAAKNKKLGGYNPNSIKKHKHGLYKGYWCDSSWELAYIIYNLEHGINFKRNTQKFDYIFENKKSKFIPDFILENGTFVEIKGYMGKEARAKLNYFKEKILVIELKEIQKYLDYVISKYGKGFTDLYETKVFVGDA